jgi:TonB family protein
LIGTLGFEELRALLLHEEAHRLRRDPLRALLQRILGALLFFYPLLGLVQRRLGEATELVCDERVAESGVEGQTFARAISKALRFGFAPIPSTVSAGVGGRSTLHHRIVRITTPWRYSMRTDHRLILLAVVLLVAAGSFLPVPLKADRPATDQATMLASEETTGGPQDERLLDLDKQPRIIQETLVKPVYPEEESEAGIEGRIVLRVEVIKDGTSGKIVAEEEVEGHPAFTEAAIAAVRKWRFEPGEIDGEPVTCEVRIPVEFRLDDRPAKTARKEGIEESPAEEPLDLDKQPTIIQDGLVQPVYPVEEKKAAIEGTVLLRVEVTREGRPGKIGVEEEVEGHPAFTEAAIEAVRQWRFEPGEIDGEPVTCEVKVPIQFRLK